jgi:hypothetical protein
MSALAAAPDVPSPLGSVTPAASPPPLEDGWQTTTPPGDTLTRQYVDNHAAYLEAVAGAGGGRFTRTSWYAAADLGRPATVLNAALLLHPDSLRDPTATRAMLSELDAFYSGRRRHRLPVEPVADAGSAPVRLAARGPPAADAAATRGAAARRLGRAGRARRRRRRSAALGACGRRGVPVPRRPAMAARSIPRPAHPRRRPDAAVAGLRPGRAGHRRRALRRLRIAHFSFGVTLPLARRRGHWYALVRERLLSAPDLPAAGLFADDSRPGAERVGFLPVSRFTLWSRPR